ncbi:MAG: hypothetical protein PWQ14_333 [Rikenellaceae bacterium]|nr:hypothetical protein [Rikenellaceae bacterium]
MSTNGNNIEKSFWQLISNIQNISKVEIPIIQRDYAQGREDEKTNKIRELFLDSLIKAIESEDSKLELDFVYGDIKNGVFQPLDGQQRLTTLWLLHWYIAFKAGTLKKNETIFKNFTYETRTSSREFCNKLCEFSVQDSSKNVVNLIENQTWFFSEWKQDPTIQSMLTMLGGTSIKDNKANEIFDGFDEVFEDTSKSKFEKYWEILSDENKCPIVFYYLDLLDLKLSDDLYIKMNARGKQLTDFENFKADLVGYIKNENIEHENNIKESIAHKLDTTWTDIFWKNKSPNNKIDEIYFAFINRFLLNCLITYKEKKDKYLYTDKKLEDENKLFKYLYGDRGNDINVKYYGFDIYKTEKPVIKTGITKLKTVLNRLETLKDKDNINKFFQPNWDENSGFCFIPEYKSNNNKEYIPTTLTQPQRVVFYAICCYFEKDNYDELNFKQWMRVVWNIVENASIKNISDMIKAMQLIDNLAEYSHDIYNHLIDRHILTNDFTYEQMKEEKEKARQIIKDMKNTENNGKTWEEKIIEAEKYAFFKGAIRFLLRDEKGEYYWDKFDARFEKAQKYFDKNGVKEEYKKDAILLRVLISYFNNIDQFKGQIFDNNATSWKSILINSNLIVPLNKFFEIDDALSIDLKSFNSNITDKDKEQLRYFQNDLCKTPIITHFSEKSSLHWWYYGKYSVFPYNAKSQRKIFVLADKRNEVLSDLEKKGIIEVDGWQKVNDLPFYKGREIYFTSKLNGKKYQWFDCLKEKQDNGNWQKIENITLDDLKEYLENQK